MWVPPCTLYVSAIISLLCRWYAAMDDPPQLAAPRNHSPFEANHHDERRCDNPPAARRSGPAAAAHLRAVALAMGIAMTAWGMLTLAA